jgi:mRNA interferase MazF
MRQRDIWRVRLPSTLGHAQAGERPALILQSDAFLLPLPTLLIVPFTSTLAAARFPGTLVVQPDAKNGLTTPSVALVFQTRAVDKRDLVHKMGEFDPATFTKIQDLLRQLTAQSRERFPPRQTLPTPGRNFARNSYPPLCERGRGITIGRNVVRHLFLSPHGEISSMKRIGVLLAGLAAGLFLVGESYSGDKGAQDKTKTKTSLPTYWSKLGLTKDQKKAVEIVRKTYGGKIAEMKKKLDSLKKQEQEELLKILTSEQKTELRRIIASKAGLDAPPPEKKSESKDKKGG